MSGTAPSDPAPSRHILGNEQKSLDSNQHGQAQNIIDETKDTYGPASIDRNIGENIDKGKVRGKLSDRVDDLVNQTLGSEGDSGTEKKAERLNERGFKVGERPGGADLHSLAKGKQP
ncbi:hypothetical protein B0T10DRAFT_550119 [Thelonectria olida]|uniref:Uncharacterized protein n=1 Tax=Thelonectria olida TaxID=1576542 RepID=A0A9P9AMH2_9HYPO|nr:hypothetical protein B0T10DRAFT_550119 [Thelonectria olida]